MPQLNPSPWFFVMVITWMTMILLITKLTTTQTHTTPTKTPKPNYTQSTWPW
uniref:ATP synthase complex subunit 8 n=1 Tax=Chlamydosaurus kingii TaxID=103699 RepID=A4KVX3_CHLKI|nr:ATP synthase F0 subunit 8 [Chlamydosaurus kingii]ABK53968.1 ATPase subunit 8 [Chlamydosaurus kingii]ABK53981.1 ATPase subunit 8 [Chlamydosaurus kingii]ABK53994.1 ATPase subunit 8 [Chlamydosaurus kingii]